MSRDLFAGLAQQEIPIRQYRGKSPMFFRSLSSIAALFAADARAIRALLPPAVLARYGLVEIFPGRGLAAVQCMRYAETDIGPYDEVALSIVIRDGARPLLWVQELPVTTEAALYGGLDYFGFPKYLADISFRENRRHRVCTLRDRETGALIAELEVRKPRWASPLPLTLALETVSILNGKMLRAGMRLQAEGAALSLMPGAGALHLTDHPRARSFATLGLGPLLGTLTIPRARALLEMPRS